MAAAISQLVSSHTVFFEYISLKIGTQARSMAKLSCVEGFSNWTIFEETRGQIQKKGIWMTLGTRQSFTYSMWINEKMKTSLLSGEHGLNPGHGNSSWCKGDSSWILKANTGDMDSNPEAVNALIGATETHHALYLELE
jgi:hypothetical protein